MKAFMTAAFVATFFLVPMAAAVAQIAEETRQVSVQDQSIKLPEIEGFREIYGMYPQMDRLVEQFVPETNRLLAFYLSGSDMEALQKDAAQGFKRYAMTQTVKQGIVIRSEKDFAIIKDETKRGLGGSWDAVDSDLARKTLDNAQGYFQKNYDMQVKLELGETKVIATPIDSTNALSILLVNNFAVTTAEGTKGAPMAASVNVVNVRGRLVFIYVYSSYKGAEDLKFVDELGRKYLDDLFALNGGDGMEGATGTGTPEEGAGSSINWINAAILGVLAAGILAIVLTVFGTPGSRARKKDETR